MGRPAALGGCASWDGSSCRSPKLPTHHGDVDSVREVAEAAPGGIASSGPSGQQRPATSSSQGRTRTEIEPVDSDDGGSIDSGTAAPPAARTDPAIGSGRPLSRAAPACKEPRKACVLEDAAQGSIDMAARRPPPTGQSRAARTISRVGLRAPANPAWLMDPRREVAVRELLAGKSRLRHIEQGRLPATVDSMGAAAACDCQPQPQDPAAAARSQNTLDVDHIGATRIPAGTAVLLIAARAGLIQSPSCHITCSASRCS